MDHTRCPAQPGDAADLARLQVLGSDGAIDAVDDGLISGHRAVDMLECRFFLQNATKRYDNCRVAESGGTAIGDLHAHPFDAMTGGSSDPIVPA